MSKTYYCTKCEQRHIKTKDVGQSHLEFSGEAPAKASDPGTETEEERIKRTVNLCESCIHEPAECKSDPLYGTGIGNDNVYECNGHKVEPVAVQVNCTICKDTGMVDLGGQARAFCKCGQESHDERIGLIPSRFKGHEITEDDAAEAEHRRRHGGSHDDYILAGDPD